MQAADTRLFSVLNKQRPLIMGILNVTPDSFWDGGLYASPASALRRALTMQEEGADILDIGAESTRPGSSPISLAEERRRLMPVLEKILPRLSIPVCVDTTKAPIAKEALAMGAQMINDTSALADPRMGRVIAEANARVILMHRKGPSRTMQKAPSYRDCVGEIKKYLARRIAAARRDGIAKAHILIDPGIGFGKRVQDNLAILRHLKKITALGCPVVLGISRKSFLGALLDTPVSQRLAGSLAAGIIAVLRGANILRVHDIKETVHARKVLEALEAFQFNEVN